MRRFSLITRLGDKDTAKVSVLQADSTVHELDFLDGEGRLSFGLGQALSQLASLGLRTPEVAIDLALLAGLINAADTRISRAINAQGGWTREIDLYLPVSDPDLWSGRSTEIGRMLRFLTGDRWRVFFRPRPDGKRDLGVTTNKLPLHGLEEVSLFSGGLDSLVAAVDTLATGSRPLFVSHYWDAETAKAQSYLLKRLETQFGDAAFKSIRVRMGFDRHALDTGQTEETQRGRSFLFYALASLAAASFGKRTTISVPENGLIALNVPLDPLRFGALSTRTAHPHFMASVQRLLDALGLDVELNNPYRHRTKGEMVGSCEDLPYLRSLVGSSMSCSSPAKARYKGLSPRHCGYCVPCMIRRASLHAGLGADDPTTYTVEDLSAQTLRSDRAEGEHVRSFQLIVERLRKDPDLAKILVHKPGPLTDAPAEIPAYADVFRRGVLEVAAILDGVVAEPG
jgi:hypothetical protein